MLPDLLVRAATKDDSIGIARVHCEVWGTDLDKTQKKIEIHFDVFIN